MPVRLLPSLAILLLLVLSACAPGTGPATPASQTAAAVRPDPQALPGAEIQAGATLALSYPAASLYPAGAALPDATGLARLEALAKWLSGQPQARWQASLSVAGDDAAQAQRLAEKRQELLQQFLARQGVAEDRLAWQAQAGAGPELELKPLN